MEAIEAFRRRSSVVEHKLCSSISWIVLLGNSVLMVSGRVPQVWKSPGHVTWLKQNYILDHSTCPRAFLYPLSLDDFHRQSREICTQIPQSALCWDAEHEFQIWGVSQTSLDTVTWQGLQTQASLVLWIDGSKSHTIFEISPDGMYCGMEMAISLQFIMSFVGSSSRCRDAADFQEPSGIFL